MRPFLSIELAGTVLLTGLIISLWITTLQLSAIGTRSEKVQEFRSMLLRRASNPPRSGSVTKGSAEPIALAGILDLAQQTRLNIPDITGTTYENYEESFNHGVRLSEEIDVALRRKQTDLLQQLSVAIYIILPLICLLIWRLCFRRTSMAAPATNGSAQSEDADRAILDLSSEVGKLHQSMMKSIMLSANSVQSPFIHSPSALGILRDDYTIMYANKAFSELTKSAVAELVGKNIVEFVRHPSEELTSLPLPLNDLEAVVVDRNGNSVAAEISINKYQSSKRSGLVIGIVDVSKRAELLRIRKDTLTEVSHDIRTPMTSLKLFLAMVTEGYYGSLPPSAIEALNKVLPQVDRLIRLTGNILSSEELESGSMRLRVAPNEVTGAIEAAASCLEGTARSKGQKISVRIDESIAECLIDPERMIQVLVNLISNALKYSPKHALVEISAFTDQELVVVEIADEGPGISLEQSEIIFQKFERDRAVEQGTGIGLWICRRILELHGGTLEVRPRQERTGSVFRLALPVIDSPRYNPIS